MASIAKCVYRWSRDPTPVQVKVTERISESVEVIIINEGCPDDYSTEDDRIIINEGHNEEHSISGRLRVTEDGSVIVTSGPADPNDASYKFTQYELAIPESRKKLQPRCILLESQLESLKHYFVHWNVSGAMYTVKCQPLQKYDSDGPHVDIDNDTDQKFVWAIPLEESNQFSLKTYKSSYYFAFGCDGRATLCEDTTSDKQNYSIFRFEKL